MNDLICANCGVNEVNGSWSYCDECENELNSEVENENI